MLLCSCNGKSESGPAEKSSTPTAQDPVKLDILKAVEKRILRLEVRGGSENAIALDMKSISSQPFTITLAPGFIAKTTEYAVSHDRMIVESFTHTFKPYKELLKVVRAYGTTDSPRPPAGREVKFRLEKIASDEFLHQAAAYLIENAGTNEKIAELMIWATTEKMSFDTLRKLRAADKDKPYITGRDYFETMNLLRKAGVVVGNLQFSLDVEEVILDLANILREGDKESSLDAVANLGWFYKTPTAAEALVEILEEDSNPVLREKAAEALGHSGLESMSETLLETVASDPIKKVRQAAAFSLLTLGDLRAVPLTIMFLGDSDGSKQLPSEVARKLSELTQVKRKKLNSKEWELWWVTEGGWDWLNSHGADVDSARKAMKAQHRFIRDPGSEAASLIKSEDEEAVLEWLRKLHTEEGRRQLSNPDVFDRIIETGMKTNSPAIALNIAWILRSTEEPERIEKGKKALLEMLVKKDNRSSYRDIISVLAQWKTKKAVEPLLYLLEDKELGDFAAEALKKITGKNIKGTNREEWQKLLSKHGGSVKSKFIQRLKEKEDEKLKQALSDLASSRYQRLWSEPDIFKALLGAAENIKTWEQVNAIIPILTTHKHDPRTQSAFKQMFNNAEDLETKRALIEALAEYFPNGDIVDFMLDLLDGDKRRLKMDAREALYKITGAQWPKRLRTRSDWLEYFAKHPSARWGKKQK
jgi:HEAT repeat protein